MHQANCKFFATFFVLASCVLSLTSCEDVQKIKKENDRLKFKIGLLEEEVRSLQYCDRAEPKDSVHFREGDPKAPKPAAPKETKPSATAAPSRWVATAPAQAAVPTPVPDDDRDDKLVLMRSYAWFHKLMATGARVGKPYQVSARYVVNKTGEEFLVNPTDRTEGDDWTPIHEHEFTNHALERQLFKLREQIGCFTVRIYMSGHIGLMGFHDSECK